MANDKRKIILCKRMPPKFVEEDENIYVRIKETNGQRELYLKSTENFRVPPTMGCVGNGGYERKKVTYQKVNPERILNFLEHLRNLNDNQLIGKPTLDFTRLL